LSRLRLGLGATWRFRPRLGLRPLGNPDSTWVWRPLGGLYFSWVWRPLGGPARTWSGKLRVSNVGNRRAWVAVFFFWRWGRFFLALLDSNKLNCTNIETCVAHLLLSTDVVNLCPTVTSLVTASSGGRWKASALPGSGVHFEAPAPPGSGSHFEVPVAPSPKSSSVPKKAIVAPVSPAPIPKS
jgi:hypothetical protein